MKKTLFVCLTILSAGLFTNAQQRNAGSASKASLEGTYLGFAIPISDDVELLPQLSHIVSENPSKNETALEAYKNGLIKTPSPVENKGKEKKTRGNEPVLEVGYNAHGNNGTPSDNTAAVNKNNQLICIVNSSIRYYNTTTGASIGAIIGLGSFFSTPQNGALKSNNLCDPKVMFDPQAEKFIIMAQTCDGNSATSQVLVAFSKTSDPTAGWYFYQFNGNPSAQVGQQVWFDYPKIGVSNSDFYVTGNLFNNSDQYVQSVVFQINKIKCYAGNALGANDALIWYNITNDPFTLVPMSNGQLGGYGNQMYMCATLPSFGSTNIGIYEITNTGANNPQLVDQYVNIIDAPAPGNGDQNGTNLKLNSGDNRGMDGYYLNGTIHYVFHCNATGNYSGINYARLIRTGGFWSVLNNETIKIANTDLAFPSIASFGWTPGDQSALIYFNYSSTSSFPGMKAIYVDGSFNKSNPIEVKTGTGFVNYGAQGGEVRWGDYSAVTRVHNATKPTVWCFGMYGNTNHNWTNHFAKLSTSTWPTGTEEPQLQKSEELSIYPNPVVDDMCNIKLHLEVDGNLEITLLDMSGKYIRTICRAPGIKGDNLFSFNKGALPTGNYIVSIVQNDKLFRNEKISVIH
jgi:hypothetical protein